jgi:hypothetical protein
MVVSALFRARWGIAGLLVVAAAGVCIAFPRDLPLRAVISAFVLSAIVSFVHLRHVGLAVLAASVPLPGLLIAHGFGAADPLTMALCYLPGFACALFMADEIAANVAHGHEQRAVCEEVFAKSGASGGIGIGIAAIGLVILSLSHGQVALAATLGAGLSAILILPLAASALPFGEDFVTRANRLREWRERMLDPVAAIAQPRWALAATGVGIVFAVLGYFGAHPVLDATEYAIFTALFLSSFIAGFGLTWEWRRALALPLTLALLILIGMWGLAEIHEIGRLEPLVQILGVCALPLLFLIVEASRHLTDDAASASSLALSRRGPVTLFFFAACALVALFQMGDPLLVAVAAVMLLFGCIGALLWLPAIAGALETLFPRRSTLEARYRVR